MSGLESLTGSGLAREAQAVAANFQIQVAHKDMELKNEDLNIDVETNGRLQGLKSRPYHLTREY